MSLQSPIFDNAYVTVGVAALLIVLLVLLLVLLRRGRSKASQSAETTARQPGAPPVVSTRGVAAPPLVGAGPAAPQPPPPGRPLTGLPEPPPPGPAIDRQAPSPALDHRAGTRPAEGPRVGDPVVAMIASLLDDPGELTDAGLRRLELFKPERVLLAVDDMNQSLSGRDKGARRAKLAGIRQYAQSLQIQPQPSSAAAEAGGPPPIPVPPPGSGTAVLPPEAWGALGGTAVTIPLDTELSYLEDSFEQAEHRVDPPRASGPPPTPEPPLPAPPAQDDTPAGVTSPQSTAGPDAARSQPVPPHDYLETPEPPPAFPAVAVVRAPPEPPAPDDRPPVPQAPPAYPVAEPGVFAIRETAAAGSSVIAREELTPGGPAEEWEQPAIVERDTLEQVNGAETLLVAAPTLRAEQLLPMAAPPGAPARVSPPPTEPSAPTPVDVTALPADEQEAALDDMTPVELGRLHGPTVGRELQLAAIRRLEGLGSSEALEALEGYLDDPDPDVLIQALGAAERMLARLTQTEGT